MIKKITAFLRKNKHEHEVKQDNSDKPYYFYLTHEGELLSSRYTKGYIWYCDIVAPSYQEAQRKIRSLLTISTAAICDMGHEHPELCRYTIPKTFGYRKCNKCTFHDQNTLNLTKEGD